MNPQNSFTRDYRLKEHGDQGRVLLFTPKKQGGWTSQDSINNDLPALPWIISGSFVFVGLFFIWMWLLAILLEPQATHTLAVYNPDLPISEHNNKHTANPLTPSTELPLRLSEPLPDGNGLFYTSTLLSAGSPSESVRFPTSVSPSLLLERQHEGSFYSQTSELLELSGVLLNPDLNDGWED